MNMVKKGSGITAVEQVGDGGISGYYNNNANIWCSWAIFDRAKLKN